MHVPLFPLACCTQCCRYMQYLHKGQGSLVAKQEAARNWRAHLREQYHSRLLYWQLRGFSRQHRRQSPSSGGSVLTIIIDSMDKIMLVWPQYAFRQPKSLERLHRPRMVLTAAIAHGWTVEFSLTDDEVTPHGSSHFCGVPAKTRERVQEIADRDGASDAKSSGYSIGQYYCPSGEFIGRTVPGSLSGCRPL